MKHVVVIGNSSIGKTTVSRKLATLLDVPLLELDGFYSRDPEKNIAGSIMSGMSTSGA
jgi:shikimate kinase